MILHAEQGQILVAHAFVGVVVQVDVRDFDVARRERFRIDAETMILRGDFHLAGEQVFDRVIRAVMPEFQLECFAAEGEAAKLVPKADAEDWNASSKLSDIFDGVGDGFGVARAIGEKDASRPHRKHVFGGSLGRNDGDVAMMVDKQAKNIELDAVIVSDHFEFLGVRAGAGFAHLLGPGRGGEIDGTFLPVVGPAAAHAASQLLPSHQRQLLRFKNKLIGRRTVSGDYATQSAQLPYVANQRARINIPDNRNFVAIQIELRGFGGTPVRSNLRELANDQRFDIRPSGLLIIEIRADITDVGIRQANDLARIAWIRENFLVTGEAGIENDFTAAARDRAGRTAVKYAPVFERENCGSMLDFRQCVLRTASFIIGLGSR